MSGLTTEGTANNKAGAGIAASLGWIVKQGRQSITLDQIGSVYTPPSVALQMVLYTDNCHICHVEKRLHLATQTSSDKCSLKKLLQEEHLIAPCNHPLYAFDSYLAIQCGTTNVKRDACL